LLPKSISGLPSAARPFIARPPELTLYSTQSANKLPVFTLCPNLTARHAMTLPWLTAQHHESNGRGVSQANRPIGVPGFRAVGISWVSALSFSDPDLLDYRRSSMQTMTLTTPPTFTTHLDSDV
jgi:hypothetical protein